MKLAWLALATILLAGCTAPTPAVGTDPVLGNGDLTVRLYEDYQCPHCRDYALSDAFQHLLDTWVANGTIKLVFQHVAFVGPHSESAAVMSRCVAAVEPAAWLAWDHAVYDYQARGGIPQEQALNQLASEAGIDVGAVNACRAQPGASATVQAYTATFASYRHGTPALVIAGVAYNPNDTETVDTAIQAAL